MQLSNEEWDKIFEFVAADPSFEAVVKSMVTDDISDSTTAATMRGVVSRAVNEVYRDPDPYDELEEARAAEADMFNDLDKAARL